MRCHIELIGRLAADPEFCSLTNGDRHAILSIETTKGWHDRTTGERKSRSTWHDLRVTKSGIVKAINRSHKAGDLVFLSGSLRYSAWTDSLQVRRKTAEIAVKGPDHQLIVLTVAEQGPPG